MDQRLTPVAFTAPAVFRGKPAADAVREFSGVAYGGGVVTDHPFLDSVVFDLASTTLVTPAAALYGHFDEVGVIESASVGERIEITGKLFADLAGNAAKIASMADRGLPWQLSVGIWPGRIEEVRAGVKVALNGREIDGPVTVFRDNRVREVSFVSLGADHTTKATIFTAVSEGGRRSIPATELSMPEQISREEYDRTVAELNAQITAANAATATEKTRADALEAQFAARQRDERVAAVKALFTASGREFTDEKAKPYLEMDETTFTAVSADLKAAPARDPNLFSHQATDGAGDVSGQTAEDITKQAQAFIVEQRAKLGREFSVAEAVAHVTGRVKLA
ncbi:MAG: hypothetical protein IT518_04715 [Burkholderiales bacterium]|nr:hypothetical protein [Burkholderiales bacterium]